MRRYLLDTSIWIGLARGEEALLERLGKLHPTHVFCYKRVCAELMFSARKEPEG